MKSGAQGGIWTRDLILTKDALYPWATWAGLVFLAWQKTIGAGDEIRTRDIQLGRLTLYQLSYSRKTTMN